MDNSDQANLAVSLPHYLFTDLPDCYKQSFIIIKSKTLFLQYNNKLPSIPSIKFINNVNKW